MRLLLVDNSKPELAYFTPKLEELLRSFGSVRVCRSRQETNDALNLRWDAAILSGSSLNMSESLNAAAIAKDLNVLLRLHDTPCFGVCFGMQLMAVAYGGEVSRLDKPRRGWQVVDSLSDGACGLAFFAHQDYVSAVPDGFVASASSNGIVCEMHSAELMRGGVQYHPEESNGECRQTVERFLSQIACTRFHYAEDKLSMNEFRCIAFLLGHKRPQDVARQFGIHRSTVERAWEDFRARFRIPAIMT